MVERAKPPAKITTHAKALALVVFGSVVGLDQASKTAVLQTIDPDERLVLGPLSLVRRYNTGVAFSLGNGSAATAWIATFVVAVLLVWVVRTISRGAQPLFAALLAAIAGGGVGNQLDRLFRGERWNKGAVIDFVDVGFWPIFNVADMALSIGCAVLAAWTLLGGGPEAPVARASASVAEGLRSRGLSAESVGNAQNANEAPRDQTRTETKPLATDMASSADQHRPSDNDFSTKGG